MERRLVQLGCPLLDHLGLSHLVLGDVELLSGLSTCSAFRLWDGFGRIRPKPAGTALPSLGLLLQLGESLDGDGGALVVG